MTQWIYIGNHRCEIMCVIPIQLGLHDETCCDLLDYVRYVAFTTISLFYGREEQITDVHTCSDS